MCFRVFLPSQSIILRSPGIREAESCCFPGILFVSCFCLISSSQRFSRSPRHFRSSVLSSLMLAFCFFLLPGFPLLLCLWCFWPTWLRFENSLQSNKRLKVHSFVMGMSLFHINFYVSNFY